MSKIYEALRQAQSRKSGGNEPGGFVPKAPPPRWWWQRGRGFVETHPTMLTAPARPFMMLLQRLQSTLAMQPRPIIQVLSARRAEGVTTIAYNLARAITGYQGRRVLLINMSDDAALTSLGVPAGNDIDRLMTAGDQLELVLHKTSDPNLLAVSIADQPGEAITVQDLAELFENLRPRFDAIIIDGGSVLRTSLASVCAAAADGVLIVVEAEKTRGALVVQLRRRLEAVNANIIGAVLNKRRVYIPDFIYKWL